MNLCKRTFALLLVLCMVVPMCLFHVSAANAKVEYKFAAPTLNLKYENNGLAETAEDGENMKLLKAAYKDGTINFLPVGYKSAQNNPLYLHSQSNYSNGKTCSTPYDGLKANTKTMGDWYAMKIKSPGDGNFKITVNSFSHSGTAQGIAVYILPGDTALANIDSKLTAANLYGDVNAKGGSSAYKKVISNDCDKTFSAKASDGEYIVVFKTTKANSASTDYGYVYVEGITLTESNGSAVTPTTPTNPATPTTPVNPGNPGTSNEDYSLFHSSFTGLEFDGNGGVALSKVAEQLNSLYASGAMKAIPMASKTEATMFLNYSAADTSANGDYKFDGVKLQRAKVGDYFAFKFKSPGAGNYSIVLEHFYLNANNAAAYDVYVLPGNTAESKIESLLTKDNKTGSFAIESDSANARKSCTSQICMGFEMEANADYILVLAVKEDKHNPDSNRVDIMFTGLSFGDGLGSGSAAFDPILGEVAVLDPIMVADFYRAAVGVNPANGNDLVYLLFKGNTMLVYDIDAKQMIDQERIYGSTPFSTYIDDDNNLWISGSGSPNIQKYDPRTGELITYNGDVSEFGGKKTNAYGLSPDGQGNLYFGYYGWIAKINMATGEITNVSGTQLSINGEVPDGQFTGYGGMGYKDGFLYIGVNGDLNKDKVVTNVVVKYDIANKQIVDYVDVSDSAYGSSYGINNLNLMGDLLIGTFSNRQIPIYIDISGDKMQRIDAIEGNPSCFTGGFSDPINGKVYVAGYVDEKEVTKCIYEYDPQTRTARRLSAMLYMTAINATGGLCTVEGEELLSGQVIVTPYNNTATGMIDLVFYNPANEETVIWSGISEGYGTSADLRDVTVDPTGRYVVTGAYGTNLLAIHDLQTGETKTIIGHSHQTDSLRFYGGYLWVGNYNLGSVTRVNIETGEVTPLFNLMESVFQQKRMFALTAGDNKIFCGTVPDTGRFGDVLVWYDIDTDLTYVAAGPNPDQVYYADTTASFVVWRNVATDEIEDFDEDGDGLYDFDFILDDKGDEDPSNDVKEQRFNGVIENQCINDIVYKDGYIIGTTTKSNGMNVGPDYFEGNAQLFIYDVAAMKLVATYDISNDISNLIDPETNCIPWLDGIEEDPYEPGKFWGTVNDTLYSFTVDFDTLTISVKEELSLGKGNKYRHASSTWHARSIVFEGDYLFMTTHSYGTFMVDTSKPSNYTQVSVTSTSRMVLGGDGNLYYFSNTDPQAKDSIAVFKIAELAKNPVAQSVQKVINALPEAATMEHEVQVLTAYWMYSDLPEDVKALVNADKLNAAISALADSLAAKADQLIDAIGEVTIQSEPAIRAARNYYDGLPATVQAKVTKLAVLEAAEAKIAELKAANPTFKSDSESAPAPKNNIVLIIVIAAAVVLVVAGVVVVLVLRKKKSTAEASAEENAADEKTDEE